MSKGPTKGTLVSTCETLANDVRVRKLATVQEIAEYRPERGVKAPAWEWWMFHSQLVAFRRREEWHEGRAGNAEEVAFDAQREEPIEVQLLPRIDPETALPLDRFVLVYPKSADALMWFTGRDACIEWLAGRLESLKTAMESGDLNPDDFEGHAPTELIDAAYAALSHELSAICAQACLGGVELGPDPDEIPEEFQDIDPMDVVKIQRAFQEVNGGRLEFLQALIKPTPGGSDGRLSWAVFFARLGKQYKMPVSILMKRHSLIALLASARLSQSEQPDDEEMAEAMGG